MGGDAVGHKTAQEGGGEQQEPGSLPRVIHSKKTPGKQWSIHDLEKKSQKRLCAQWRKQHCFCQVICGAVSTDAGPDTAPGCALGTCQGTAGLAVGVFVGLALLCPCLCMYSCTSNEWAY